MGKAAKWFRGLLGLKKPDSSPAPAAKPQKEKRRWSFVKSYREKDDHHRHNSHHSATKIGGAELRAAASGGAISCTQPLRSDEDSAVDPNKHAIAVAAATAAVAEAAVAAAHAAAAVVRLTSSGRCTSVTPAAAYGSGAREEWWAAVKIQSAFRGFLARKALRALKGLVRLQALVRGHIERKRRLRRMHALLRAQARARAGRSQMSESSQSSSKSSQAHYTDPATPEKSEHVIRVKSSKYDQFSTLKRNSSNFRVPGTDQDRPLSERNRSDRYATGIADDERTDKILEIDTGKQNHHHSTTKRRNLYPLSSDQNSHSFTTSKDSTAHQTLPSPSSHEVQSLTPLKFPHEEDDNIPFCTADNSPQFFSASSKGGSSRRSPFTPSKSDGTRSYLSGYSDHPNYMAYTESSRAKARSLSAPKQRPHVDRSGSWKRNSIHGFGESRSGSLKVSVSALQANFTNKAYPGSGRLDRLGMPVGYKY